MTGHQEHPGTGRTAMSAPGGKVSIEKILEAVGVASVEIVDPLQLEESVRAVKKASELPGVKAVVFRSPCIAVSKAAAVYAVGSGCIGCKKCIRELGLPAIRPGRRQSRLESSICNGCLSARRYARGAISKRRGADRDVKSFCCAA
jgi:indolepyruvate ferredoxin oxidoreductase alpha subunit